MTSDKWTSKGALINQLFFTSLGNQMLIHEVPRASSWQLQQRGDREGILAPHWPPCSFPNSSNFDKSSRNRSHREVFPRTEERLSDQSDQAGRAEQNRTSRIRYSLAPTGSVVLYPPDSSLHPGLRKGGDSASFATATEYERGRSSSSGCPREQSLAWPPASDMFSEERVTEPLGGLTAHGSVEGSF